MLLLSLNFAYLIKIELKLKRVNPDGEGLRAYAVTSRLGSHTKVSSNFEIISKYFVISHTVPLATSRINECTAHDA